MRNELKSRVESKGSSVPFTVAQVRTKFKKCISECKNAALTIKTATGVKRFKTIKIREFGLITYSNWSRLVIHAVLV